MKKGIVSLVLFLVMMANSIFPILSFGNNEKDANVIENTSNAVLGSTNNKESLSNQQEEEECPENYTEEYKKWLELPEEERAKCEVIPRKYKVPFSVLYDDEEDKTTTFANRLRKGVITKAAQEEQLPEKFDLRDKIEIPVRNQFAYGLCWNFASIKCLETYLALNGYGNYDFSELHLDYLESKEFGTDFELHEGRFFDEFEDYVMNNLGPVLESEVPYNSKYTEEDYENLCNINQKAYVLETINFPDLTALSEESPEQIEAERKK